MANDNTVTMEGVRIVFRNFSGKEGKFNREGDRGFAVLLDPDVASRMESDGWNVKWLKPREPEDDPQAYLPVAISYKGKPPRVVMLTSRARTNLGEMEIDVLDWVDIQNVDLIVRPYQWVVNDKSGIKAYLKSIFVTIEEDELELKYASDEPPARGGRPS